MLRSNDARRTPFLYCHREALPSHRAHALAIFALTTVAWLAFSWALTAPERSPMRADPQSPDRTGGAELASRTSPAPVTPSPRPRAAEAPPPKRASVAKNRKPAAAPRPGVAIDPRSVGLLGALRQLEAEGALAGVSRGSGDPDAATSTAEVLRDTGPLALASETAGAGSRKGADRPEAIQLVLATDGVQDVTYGDKPAPELSLDDGAANLAELAAVQPLAGQS